MTEIKQTRATAPPDLTQTEGLPAETGIATIIPQPIITELQALGYRVTAFANGWQCEYPEGYTVNLFPRVSGDGTRTDWVLTADPEAYEDDPAIDISDPNAVVRTIQEGCNPSYIPDFDPEHPLPYIARCVLNNKLSWEQCNSFMQQLSLPDSIELKTESKPATPNKEQLHQTLDFVLDWANQSSDNWRSVSIPVRKAILYLTALDIPDERPDYPLGRHQLCTYEQKLAQLLHLTGGGVPRTREKWNAAGGTFGVIELLSEDRFWNEIPSLQPLHNRIADTIREVDKQLLQQRRSRRFILASQ